MKRIYLFSFIFVCTFLTPVLASAEFIEQYTAEIELREDSSFTVTETIAYQFTSDRHGIFRYIPTTHAQKSDKWYKERYTKITIDSVTMDGTSVPYEVTDEPEQIYIKIGDPNSVISGLHIYEITYTVEGGISYFQNGGAELYWNATGFEWQVGMKEAQVTLRAPEGLFTDERACYSGSFGVSNTCTRTFVDEEGVHFIARELGPMQGITIAQAIDRSKIEKVSFERTNIFWFLIPAALIWFVLLILFVYRYKTEYRTGRPIIAQYEPYEDFKPMYTGLLFDGILHPQDITACIVYLAEQGYLKIRKVDRKVLFFFEVDDYEIEMVKELDDAVTTFQRRILELLFGSKTMIGAKVTLSHLRSDMSKQRKNHAILQNLKKDLEQDLEDSGFFQVTIPTSYILTGVGAVLVVLYLLFDFISSSMPTLIFFIVSFVVISLGILAFAYRRRTRKGYEALDHLEGFKLFLSVTDKERFAFHNAPSKSPEQFMEYLPYAIAFGVEEEWAEVFKDITIPNPSWYDGGSTAGSFSAVNLTSSLGAFSSAFTASSGSSGSSGGGSAGGGGGGGGGGSW